MDANGSTSDTITIRLTGDEAFVLSHALSEAQRSDALAHVVAGDEATRRVINDLIASLEPLVDEAFGDGYAERLAFARFSARQLSAELPIGTVEARAMGARSRHSALMSERVINVDHGVTTRLRAHSTSSSSPRA